MNKVPRWVFRNVGNKTFDFSSKKKDFLPKKRAIYTYFQTKGTSAMIIGAQSKGTFFCDLWVDQHWSGQSLSTFPDRERTGGFSVQEFNLFNIWTESVK